MRRSRSILHALLVQAALGLGAREAACAPRVSTVTATPIFRFVTALSAGGTVTFSTDNLSAGADTVIHLVRARDMMEVARNDDRAPGQPASSITYTVPAFGAGDYWLFVRAKTAASAGTCDFSGNGVTLPGVRFGGVPVAVDHAPDFVYETALLPNGSTDTRLLALDTGGRVVAYSDDEGVGLASRLSGDRLPQLGHVVVGSYSAATGGHTVLYTNDTASDRDGDGLGSALEAELGTCDDHAGAGCGQVFNPKDTDRDGLEDALELFGLDDPSQPLYLPAWGADPRHKDLFIEADSQSGFAFPSVSEDQAVQIAADFAAGPAAHLVNPDGRDGVSVHIDARVRPLDPANATKIGDWGGANVIADPSNSEADLGANRSGIFIQAVRSGGAQGCVNDRSFSWSGATATFNHELGHCLGLDHEGPTDRRWGLNCSPIRRSTMSYAASTFPVTGFSDGSLYSAPLNPNRLCEQDGLGNELSGHLNAQSWAQPDPGKPRHIDWNRDGVIDDCEHPVRAPINWLPSQACDAHIQNELRLAPANVVSPPAIAQMGRHLYVFYIDQNQALRYRRSVQSGEFQDGGCPNGSAPGSLCSGWLGEVSPIEGSVASVNAFSVDGWIHVAFLRPGGTEIQTISTRQQDATGLLLGWTAPQPVQGSKTIAAGEMQVLYVDRTIFGVDRLVGMFWTDWSTRRLTWAILDPAFQVFRLRGGVTSLTGAPIMSSDVAPTLAFWGKDNLTATGDHLSFMVLTDWGNRMRLYRYVTGDRWVDISASLPANAVGIQVMNKIGFAFRPLTDGDGRIMDELKGEFSLLFAKMGESPPRLAISDVVDGSAGRHPSAGLRFTRAGKFGHPFYGGGTTNGGYDLFASASLPYLKGALTQSNNELWFQPHADGIFNKDFVDRSEFMLMERGICLALRLGLSGQSFCGPIGLNGF